ncbi:hypothetical protein EK21DRAFT_95203 [Setomelanomma holmii]|uniref:DUF6536 domain-containing protein n=1 Tax=Setomelanomma holmii TaxID=210430 RepID=A0A9P4GWN0_9PLEO|nr:hypothetical protein EK21DRAFT_95203 [Setomelanomma holmii]
MTGRRGSSSEIGGKHAPLNAAAASHHRALALTHQRLVHNSSSTLQVNDTYQDTPSKLQTEVSYTTIASRDDAFLLAVPPDKDQQQPHLQKRFLSGWRIGALLSLVGAVAVFIFNLSLTIWVSRNPKYKVQDGLGTLFQGSCARTRQLNVWVHLLVNVVSTLLLCASNYCMQVLCSPNRDEIDRAHEQRRWLHIGIPSIHNLLRIGKERSFLCIVLLLSSMPLHLLFNSVVFTNLQANSYTVIPTMEDWLHG